jgi:hypothetical protein
MLIKYKMKLLTKDCLKLKPFKGSFKLIILIQNNNFQIVFQKKYSNKNSIKGGNSKIIITIISNISLFSNILNNNIITIKYSK